MALDYTLREGMTNGDLPDEGQNHFAFLTHMMAIGVPTLKDKDLEEFKSRIIRYALVSEPPRFDTLEGHISWMLEYADVCEGMTTNISPLTNAEFNKRLSKMLDQRAKNMRKRLQA